MTTNETNPAPTTLAPDERELIELYRDTRPINRPVFMRALKGVLEEESPTKPPIETKPYWADDAKNFREAGQLMAAFAGIDPTEATKSSDTDLEEIRGGLVSIVSNLATAIHNTGDFSGILEMAKALAPIYHRVVQREPAEESDSDDTDECTLAECVKGFNALPTQFPAVVGSRVHSAHLGDIYHGNIVEVGERGCWILFEDLSSTDQSSHDGAIPVPWRYVTIVAAQAAEETLEAMAATKDESDS